MEALFDDFDAYLKHNGYLAMGGQIIDASIVAVPKQRNSKQDNSTIKAGKSRKTGRINRLKLRQKDLDAR